MTNPRGAISATVITALRGSGSQTSAVSSEASTSPRRVASIATHSQDLDQAALQVRRQAAGGGAAQPA